MSSIGIIVTTYRNPGQLARMFNNMEWSGIPPVPVHVVEDPSWRPEDRPGLAGDYAAVCDRPWVTSFETMPDYGCMQGAIQYAFEHTSEDWLIYVPDDVIFTKGALLNEFEAAKSYGREFVAGIQVPYWNAQDLVHLGVMGNRADMFGPDPPLERVPRHRNWDGDGQPHLYIGINGAGFIMSRRLFEAMGGFPTCTWRFDEWASYQSWQHGMICVTMAGPPRIHFMGGATPLEKPGLKYHTVEAWMEATGGKSTEVCGEESYARMEIIRKFMREAQPPFASEWDGIQAFFEHGMPI